MNESTNGVEQTEGTNGAGAPVLPPAPFVDTKMETKLNTIQAVGLTIEQRIDDAKSARDSARGVIAGLIAADRQALPKVMADLQKLIDLPEEDENHMNGEAAKPILNWLQKAREEIQLTISLNQKELQKQEGIIEGLSKAVDICEFLHKQEAQKKQRRETMSDVRHGRDADGRPIPLRERYSDGDEEEEARAQAKAKALGEGGVMPETPPIVMQKKRGKKKTQVD